MFINHIDYTDSLCTSIEVVVGVDGGTICWSADHLNFQEMQKQINWMDSEKLRKKLRKGAAGARGKNTVEILNFLPLHFFPQILVGCAEFHNYRF